jgi:hypothetical protein
MARNGPEAPLHDERALEGGSPLAGRISIDFRLRSPEEDLAAPGGDPKAGKLRRLLDERFLLLGDRGPQVDVHQQIVLHYVEMKEHTGQPEGFPVKS